jgi:hypothetical protein
MPNHIHCILYFPKAGFNINTILSNAKRFMAYEIVNRVEKQMIPALQTSCKMRLLIEKKEETITAKIKTGQTEIIPVCPARSG